ncbi:DUF7557 family protein [Halocatena pleomorpha]|uniref:Uncharacterized protein n=1 Tax=Halocatena pleomorpha TaxID=1785090 RepID=A0A3P3RAE9_9EURY|nr:hypothetical protein EIK79_11320 [Halocatena pleomorpha]
MVCTATANCVCRPSVCTSTSIRVSDSTQRRLDSLRRDDATFDDLLARLATRERPIDIGAWSEKDADRVRAAEKRSRESVER